jgi:cell division septation protein DedD
MPELVSSEPVADKAPQAASVGVAARVTHMLSVASSRIKSIPSRIRWTGGIFLAVLIVLALWQSVNSSGDPEVQAEQTSEDAPVADADKVGLQLNLAPATLPTEEPDTAPPSATLPVAAALVATAAPEVEEVAATLEPVTQAPAPPSVPLIPINIPADQISPPADSVDGTPEITTAVPKSVSPIPIPKAKPDIAALPTAGPYAVQLASIAVETRANQEAFRLQKQLAHILGEHEIEVEKAVIAGKGTMYRLRAGGYKSQAEARSACEQLAKMKVSCLALRR